MRLSKALSVLLVISMLVSLATISGCKETGDDSGCGSGCCDCGKDDEDAQTSETDTAQPQQPATTTATTQPAVTTSPAAAAPPATTTATP